MTSLPHVPSKHEDALRAHAFSYPEVTEDFPWGHRAIKVKGKTFIFLVSDAEGLSLSVKLPTSNGAALMMPFAEPTGYGMAKSGWVSCKFKPKETPPIDMLKQWIDESYRAVAPKKLVAQLAGGAPTAKAAKGAPPKRAATARATPKAPAKKREPKKSGPARR